MKKQNQFVQAMKCCLTNGKFALLLFSIILLFTSCKQRENGNSANNNSQTTIITTNNCEDKVGKYTSFVNNQPLFNGIVEKRDEQNYVLTLNMGILNPKFQGKCENSKLVFKVDGTDVEITGKSFIALGAEFIKQ